MTAEELICGARVLPERTHDFRGKKCLVTGACGTIGSLLLDRLTEYGAEVRGMDNNEDAVARDPRDIILGDYRDGWPRDPYDIIFLCAAYKHVILGEKFGPAFVHNNIPSEEILLQAKASNKNVHVVLVSTDKAAGDSWMGLTKRVAEKRVVGEGGVAVRLVNCAISRGSVLEKWNERLRTFQKPRVCLPTVTRMWMQPLDAVEAILEVSKRWGLYAVWGCPEISMGDMIEAFLRVNHKQKGWYDVVPMHPIEAMSERMIQEGERAKNTDLPWLKQIVRA